MPSRRLIPLALGATLLITVAIPAAAQSVTRRTLVATNPIAALFGVYTLDVERALGELQSIGVGAAYIEPASGTGDENDFDDLKRAYATFDLNYRYYPRDVFRGWSLGASVGASRVAEDRWTNDFPDQRITTDRATTVGFGFNLGYHWLIGRDDRLHLGLGVGAKRHFVISGDEFMDGDKSFALPTGRFSVGIAF